MELRMATEAQKFVARHSGNQHAKRAHRGIPIPYVPVSTSLSAGGEGGLLQLSINSPLQTFASLGLGVLASYIESLLTGSSFKPLEGPLYGPLFGTGGLLGGRPKLLDTQQAAARALESKNPAIAL